MPTEAIENALNRGLPNSPRARALCRELAGKRLAVDVGGTPWRLVVESLGESLRLTRPDRAGAAPAQEAADGSLADATVSGGPLGLLALAGDNPEAAIQRGDVRITGDAELAQRFRELASLLRPDLEEALSRAIGDTPAHYASRFVRMALDWGRKTADTTVRNVSEYLAHERGDLVPRAEAEQFLRGVDRVREDVDRLEARIALLDP